MKDYQYDVFLSFTGADRELKDSIKERLASMGLSYYDSDSYCKGQFRADFCEALDQSRVYLLLLTDNLRNDPLVTKHGRLTEVRREYNLACDLEAANELNIVILCMSEFFRFGETFHDYDDHIGWFFYSGTRGYSQVYGTVDETGALTEQSMEEVTSRCASFVEKRNAGEPVLSQMPQWEIADEKVVNAQTVVGREREVEEALAAFGEGVQTVVLRGIGGIGKTTLATDIACRCNEMRYLRCPQVVHVQELGGGGGGVHTVVSSARYVKSLYDGLTVLPERDRFERKRQALAVLPETALLVVDNYNTLCSEDIHELQAAFKCRLLITTRAPIESIDGAKVITIDRLEKTQALAMFEDICGTAVEKQEFERLYEYVGGHTITLCIMAKMMKKHRLTLTELADKMADLETLEGKVDFRHNEYGDSDTVLGHLQNLFNISGFGEGAKRILASMSLLGNGTVAVDDLMQMLSLRSRNDILALETGGFVELKTRREADGIREYVYLHPILSRLMAKLLVPTEETVPEMVRYLVEKAKGAREKLTYADASVLDDSLFYACYVLAGGNRRLSKELWEQFATVDRLKGDAGSTAEKVQALAKRLENPEERTYIGAHRDLVSLESDPTRIDVLSKYVSSLGEHAENYKWVMQCLSVTMQHLHGVEKFEPQLKQTLHTALDMAMLKADDFSVMELFTCCCANGLDTKAALDKAQAYIDSRHKAGVDNGSLMQLELLCSSVRLVSRRGLFAAPSDPQKMMEDLIGGNIGSMLKMFVNHPAALFRIRKLTTRLLKEDFSDPTALPMKMLMTQSIRLVEEGQIEAAAIIGSAVEYHRLQMENQTSLQSATDAVLKAIQALKLFPEVVVKRGAMNLAECVDLENITVASLSSLQMAALINKEFKDPKAVKQSKDLVDVIRRLRPEGHGDVLSAMVSYAEVCEVFEKYEEARDTYSDVFFWLAEHSPDSVMYRDIAKRLLNNRSSVVFEPETLYELCELALESHPDTDWHYYETLRECFKRLLGRRSNEDQFYALSIFNELWAKVDAGIHKMKALTPSAQKTLIWLLEDVSLLLCNARRFKEAEQAYERFPSFFKSCYRPLRSEARSSYLYAIGYSAYHNNQADFKEKLQASIDFYIKKSVGVRHAENALWLLLPNAIRDTEQPWYTDAVQKPQLVAQLNALAQEFYDTGYVNKNDAPFSEDVMFVKILRVVLERAIRDGREKICRLYYKVPSAENAYFAVLQQAMCHLVDFHKDHKIQLK